MYISISIITSEDWKTFLEDIALETTISILVLCFLGAFAFCISALNQKITERIIATSQTKLTEKLLTKLLSSEYALIRKYSESEVTNLIYLTTNRISNNFISGYLNIIRQVFNILVVLIATFFINKDAIIFLAPVMIVLYYINYFLFLKKVQKYNIDLSINSQNLFKYILDINHYTKEILINQKSDIVIPDITSRKLEFAKKQERISVLNHVSRSSLQYLSILSVASVILYTSLETKFTEEMRVEIITILALLGLKIAPSLNQLIQFYNKVASGKTYLDDYLTVLNNLHVTQRTSLKQIKLSKQEPNYITLSKGRVPSGKGLVFDASIDIHPGKLNILVGRSGSGKTTLLDTLGGLWGSYKGLQKAKVVYKAQKTYLHKDFFVNLFDKIQSEASNRHCSLTSSHIISKLNISDAMLQTENTSDLSGGEVQRLALLDALLTVGDIYLFDEITSGLDEELANAAFQLLREFAQENLTVIISHQTKLHQADDKVIYFQSGHMLDGR